MDFNKDEFLKQLAELMQQHRLTSLRVEPRRGENSTVWYTREDGYLVSTELTKTT